MTVGRRAVLLGLIALPLVLLVFAGWWTMGMPGRSHRGPPPPLDADEAELAAALEAHVRELAVEIGPRNVFHPEGLARAADYAAAELARSGREVREERFRVEAHEFRNLWVDLPGPEAELVVVGAHYDSAGDSPGANDNGTGVAAVLELAERLAGRSLRRTVRLVLFANEEPPFFATAGMGSDVHARGARERGEQVAAMLSIETIGCWLDEPGSQRYPPPFAWFYPDRGDFLAFVGDLRSRSLVRRCVGTFRRSTPLPCEGVAAPASVPGVGWSDQRSFWAQGWPAAMVTDTAPYRYEPYHTPGDLPGACDFARAARAVVGLERVVVQLAGARD